MAPVAAAGAGAPIAGAEPWALAPMRVADLPEILAIERASFPRPWSGALFLQEMRVGFSRVVVARPVGRAAPVLGYVCRWLVAGEIHVLNLATHPAHRRRGVGRRLLDEVLREARRRGVAAVTLEVRRSNAGARRLYETLRFAEVGVRRDYYGGGEDALIMELALPHV
jgi:ribosomal-protein-alanine N-acetyltransferase